MYRFGIIGAGSRATYMLNQLFEYMEGDATIAAVTDLKPRSETGPGASELLSKDLDNANFYTDAAEMLEKEQLDGVMIGTRCSTHARYACMVMDKGIPLFLEKPICTNIEDWRMLRSRLEQHNENVVVSFPLRVSGIVRQVKEIVQSGKLGAIEHVEAFNYVPYGSVYYNGWYRDDNETGGLFLQKATHDFDYINYIVDADPIMVAAMGSKQIFKGDRPANIKCVDCAEYRTCLDSPFFRNKSHDPNYPDMCCYAVDTGNHDSASALVRYETGMHAVYTQNFFARNKSQKRGAIFSGYKGTLEFDFYTNSIQIFPHHTSSLETIQYDASESHFGGDRNLISNFAELVKNGATSNTPLRTGLMSALMCIRATESEKQAVFCEIDGEGI